jgi:FkbM family methyltransferase
MNPFWYRTFPRLTFYARRLAGASYEREMELLDVLCDPKRTGIDVGAKVGMYTYRIRERSSDVIAFEPIPLFNNMLKAVFEGKRGRIEPVAVSNKRGKAVLRMPYDHANTAQFGRSTIDAGNPLTHEVVARTEELEVETRTIDEYEFPNVGFIKIDVEGHELSVLEGAVQTIAKHQPNLLIECNDDHQTAAVAKLASWLGAHDYDAYFFDITERQLKPIGQYDRAQHWDKHFIENFMCVPKAKADVLERLKARVATAKMGAPAR